MTESISTTTMNSYRKFILSTLITFLTFILSAQETNCGNSIDDDGDGLIDCYDGDCAGNAECSDFYFGNSITCSEDIDVTTFAIREQWASADRSATSHGSPSVGDLDQDGIPEVVVTNKHDNTVTVLNGQTGATISQVNVGFQPENSAIIANVLGGETAQILVTEDRGDGDMVLYNYDPAGLIEEWRTKATGSHIGMAGVADFDEDGDAEFYYRNEVINAQTGAKIVTGSGTWKRDFIHGTIAVDIIPGPSEGGCADCDGLELISGNEIYAINESAGTRTLVKDLDDVISSDIDPNLHYYPKYYPNWDDQWSSASIADYNLDGNLDVILTGALGTTSETYTGETTIFFWDVANDNIVTYHDPTNDFVRGAGRVNIGDVDGDGQLNANFVMNQKLYSLKEDFTVNWIQPIKEGSSGFTGCSLFDFDGDGNIEIVYRSESSLLILDGRPGLTEEERVRNELTCISRTQEEYPVIADVDGDGASEICVTCYTNQNTSFSPYSNTRYSNVRIFESDGEAWMASRSIWNQHGYYNVNINDDLTVPIEVQDHSVEFSDGVCEYVDGTQIPFPSRPLNTFLTQSPILNENGCVEFISPDMVIAGNAISATNSQCPSSEITVTFDISNEGDTDISGGLPISYYAGDPTIDGSIYLETQIEGLVNFQVDETVTIEHTIQGLGGDYVLFVVANDLGGTPSIAASYADLPNATIPECDTENNINSIAVSYNRFELVSNKLNDNRKCDDDKPNNGTAEAYFDGFIPGGLQTIYFENFEDRTNGDKSDTDDTAWSSDKGSKTPNFYGVASFNSSKMFEARQTGGANESGIVTWTSEAIDISGHTDVGFTLDLFENGGMEPASNKWRDFVQVNYDVDGTDVQLFKQYDDFNYRQASVSGLNGSTLTVTVQIHNTSSSEQHYIDNLIVQGTAPDIFKQFTEEDGFVFNWYNSGDTSNIIYTGSTNPQMAAGEFIVEAYYSISRCFSQLDTVVIQQTTPEVFAWAYEIEEQTDCADPDGEIGAFVYTTTQNGTPPPATEANPPADTLRTADGYEFTWFITSEGVTPIGTGDQLNQLIAREYTVNVIEDLTGCPASASAEILSGLTKPAAPTITAVDISTCGGTGTLSASVGGNTADYNFYWYDGASEKPTADFEGVTYTVSDPGQFTVIAELISSECISESATATLNDNSAAPTPSATLSQNNSSCVAGNGIVFADGDGSGTTAGYTFEWFLGDNTLPANALPGTAAPGAFLVSDNSYQLGGLEGDLIYTVKVTDTNTSCFETRTVEISDVPSSLVVDATQFIQNNINSCDASVRGSIDASGVVSGDVGNASIGNINSDFEQPDISEAPYNRSTFRIIDQTEISGWSTTAGDGAIELWNSGFQGVPAYSGGQFAEILANQIGALYFDLSTVPNSLLEWTFAHRGRSGTDNIRVSIGAVGSEVGQGDFATPNTDWEVYSGSYTVPDDQFITRFQFESLDAGSVGNFVDSVTFVLYPYRFELYEGSTVSGDADFINTNGVFGDLNDGDHVLVVYDNLTGCGAVEIPFTITRDITEPTIATSITHDINCETDSGEVDVTASMSTSEPSSYTYELFDGHAFTDQIGSDVTVNDGTVAQTFNLLSQGNYRIRVTNDDTGCDNFTDIVVNDETVIPTFVATSSVIDNTSCDNSNANGSVSVEIQGEDEADFTFTWYDGDDVSDPVIAGEATNFLGSRAAGDYTVVGEKNSTNCETVALTLTINNDPYIPNIIISEEAAQTDCDTGNGSLSALIDNNPDFTEGTQTTDGFTFQWQLDGVDLVDGATASNGSVPSGSQTATVSGLIADEYTLVVQHDNTDCPATENFVLSENQVIPTISLSGTTTDNTSCNTTSYTGAASVSVTPAGAYDYDWFYSSGTQVTDAGSASGSNTASLSGVVNDTYKVVATSDLSCTSDTLVVVIGFSPNKPDFTPAAIGAGTSNNTVCDATLATGDFNGQITVTPNVGVVADYTYAWFDGATTTTATSFTATNNVLSDAPGGTYTVEITSGTNACDTTITVTITDDVNTDFTGYDLDPDVTVVDDNSCNADNGSITLSTTNLDAAPQNGSGNYTFRLSNGTTAKATPDDTDNAATYEFTGLAPGDYTVEVLDNVSGCLTQALIVTVGDDPNKPDFSPAAIGAGTSNNTVCDATLATGDFNGQITVTPNVGVVADYTYTWFDGATTNAANATAYTENNNVLSDAPGGTYTVEITSGTNACDTTIIVTITDDFTDLPIVDDLTGSSTKTDLSVCEENASWPNGSISASIAGGSGNYSYRWYYGSTTNSTRLISNGDNIASRKGTGSSNAVVTGADTEDIGNLDPGFYTLQVLDSDRGCLSTSLTFEVEDDTESPDFSASVTQDNFACSSGTSTGIITVTQNSGGGAFNFEWFEGGSATGTADYTTQTVNNLDGGTYTIRVTNTATNCTYVESITISDIVPTLSVATGSTDQTNCDPNGTVTATPSITFNPAGTPTGYTSDFEFDWYLGNTTTTALAEGIDPGNGSNPTNITTASVSGLAAGNYTVVVRDNGSNCVTTQETVIIVDGISANSPTFNISGDPADGAPRNTPSDCGEESGYIIALITPNGGTTYTYEWYEGSDDYTGTTTATAISNGTLTDQGASDPQIINTSATEIRLTQITSGIYSLVATDQATGCKYQEVYDLGFIGQQTTTTIAIQNVEECPDDGQASVGIEDNPSNGIGTFAGEDDIQNYDIYLFAGSGVPADIYSNPAYTYTVSNDDGSTDTYPIVRDGSSVAAGSQVSFSSLPPGTYTAIARQKSSFNALQCWSESAIDEIEDRAYQPILGAINITDNTVCDETIAGNFNGSASVSAIKNADDDKQPGDFRFEWSGPNGFTATENNVTTSTQSNLESGDYDVTISRIIPTLDITYTSTGGTLAEGEDIEFSNGAIGVIISSPVSSPVTVYLLSGATPVGGTYEGQSSEATANVTAVAAGTDYVNGCSISETITVEDNPIDQSIFGDLSITNVLNCDPDDTGVITVQDANVTSGDVNDYEFAFYSTQNDAENDTNVLQAFSASPTYNAPSPAAGDYYIVAVNQNTGCSTNPFEATIGVETVEPELRVSAFSADTSCDADVNEGNGSITFTIDNADVNTDYDYQWYVGDNTSGTALTNTAPISGALGTLNDASAANYTATLGGIASGTYTLEVIDMDPNSDNCEAVITYTILEESLKPTLVVADNITSSNNLNCSPDNGFIQINSVKEGTNDITALGNYTFSWFRNGIAFGGTITSVASGTDNRIEDLDAAIYSVAITNTSTQCVSTANVEIEIEDTSVNPVVQLDATTADEYCDNTDNVGNGTLNIDLSHPNAIDPVDNTIYSIAWYRGTLATAPGIADNAFLFDNLGNSQGTANLLGDAAANADFTELTGLADGTYTVFIAKNQGSATNPNLGCTVFASFTIDNDNPTISIENADITATDNENCTSPNGVVTINAISEDGDNTAFALSNYTFTWEKDGAAFVDGTDGNLANSGAGTNNSLTDVAAGTYTVSVQNNVTGCPATALEVDIVIEDTAVNPVVQLDATTADEYCDNTDNVGNGTLNIDLSHPNAIDPVDNTIYSIAWYRGTLAAAPGIADNAFLCDNLGNSQGTATLLGDAAANADFTELTGLADGSYTVFIAKNQGSATNPNLGCTVFASFTIDNDNPTISIENADITATDNENCTS
ncbi:MAG: hypothetical protein AB8B73_14830, partial [Ekhidna sp.]